MDHYDINELMPVVCHRLLRDGHVALILIDLSEVEDFEEPFASRARTDWAEIVNGTLEDFRKPPLDDSLAFEEAKAIGLFLFAAAPGMDRSNQLHWLQSLAKAIEGEIDDQRNKIRFHPAAQINMGVGYSFALQNPLVGDRRVVQFALNEAKEMAQLIRSQRKLESKQLLQDMIIGENIKSLFQPIFNLQEGTVHGYEALCRGPKGTKLEDASALIAAARRNDLAFEIDHLSRRKAIEAARKLDSSYKLFINTLPFSPQDPRFRGLHLIDLFRDAELHPQQLVLEVTERQAITDFSAFVEEMSYFTNMGCLTAVDDIGGGYSELERIVHIRPNYLKLDRLLIRDIHESFVKRQSIQLLMNLAKDIDASVVAQGIERKEELHTIRELGVTYGQGFLLAQPATKFQTEPNVDLTSGVKK
jgi:EAL domain-containing protein (putative c-di-GMP-specific phosphodiesterase class I)